MDDGNGPTVAIEVSKVLADRAEEVGIDLGAFVERALRQELRRKLDEVTEAEREVLRAKLREELREEIEWFNPYTEEHGSFADRWCRF